MFVNKIRCVRFIFFLYSYFLSLNISFNFVRLFLSKWIKHTYFAQTRMASTWTSIAHFRFYFSYFFYITNVYSMKIDWFRCVFRNMTMCIFPFHFLELCKFQANISDAFNNNHTSCYNVYSVKINNKIPENIFPIFSHYSFILCLLLQ